MVTLNETLTTYLETYLTQRQSSITEIQESIQGHYDALADLEEQLKRQQDELGILTQALGILQSNGDLPAEAAAAPFPSDETYMERATRLLREAQGPVHVKDLSAHFAAEGRSASAQAIQSTLDRHLRNGGRNVLKVGPSVFCLPEYLPTEKQAEAEGNQDQRWAELVAWELRNVAKPMHLNDIAGRLRQAGTPIAAETLHRVTVNPEGIFERTGQKFVVLRSWRAATATA